MGRNEFRELVKQYADTIAFSDVCRQRETLYKDLNALKQVRPPVLIFEIPWGEIKEDELKVNDDFMSWEQYNLKTRLFQWKHFQADHTFAPTWDVCVSVNDTGSGIWPKEKQIDSTTGAYIKAHHYEDQLLSEEDVEKIKFPEISYNKEGTEKNIADAKELLGDIMPVRKTGFGGVYVASWDFISTLHGGVEPCYEDMIDRPEFMHALMKRLTDITNYRCDMYEKLNVLETEVYYLHCTPALCYDMPHKDLDKEKILLSDIWCRTSAQVLAVVSPAMQTEFDIDYAKTYANRFKRTYYGCCEPLDNKIDELKAINNLHRVSITPWANVDAAAEKIGKSMIISYKPNPAFVASSTFDPEPVEKEISHVCEVCIKNGTPFEFVLKDISTIANRWQNLEQWNNTVQKVIDRYFN